MNLEIITTETAPENVKPLLEKVQKTYGFVPNTYGVMAHAPLAVAAYLSINDLIKEYATLTPQEQQVVMLAISFENGCEYCVAVHSAVAGMVKTPPEVVASLRNETPISDARLAALAAFARSLVKYRGWVPEAEQQAFLDAGFTKGHVLEVITINALKSISNYANHLGHPALDEAFASQVWKKSN